MTAGENIIFSGLSDGPYQQPPADGKEGEDQESGEAGIHEEPVVGTVDYHGDEEGRRESASGFNFIPGIGQAHEPSGQGMEGDGGETPDHGH